MLKRHDSLLSMHMTFTDDTSGVRLNVLSKERLVSFGMNSSFNYNTVKNEASMIDGRFFVSKQKNDTYKSKQLGMLKNRFNPNTLIKLITQQAQQ